MLRLLNFGLLLSLVSCGVLPEKNTQTLSKDDASIIGHSEKFEVPIQGAYRQIGRLVKPNRLEQCTGTLVGPNLVLTAAHCVKKKGEAAFQKGDYRFQLGYRLGEALAEAKVLHVWYGKFFADGWPRADRKYDWAILKIDQNLGDRFGWMKLGQITSPRDYGADRMILAGYGTAFDGQGEKLTAHKDCAIKAVEQDGDLLITDCDSEGGDSGAPIFNCTRSRGCLLFGVHTGGYADTEGKDFDLRRGNIAASTSMFDEKLRELLN